ncbi:hypothetical protein [Vibrio jasicida]|uniref:hypothetical protein n=1 Tax=Vibrio jasicida TaxID=766224 RepID=UPI00148B897D|nr:hypothetical protein [Vibrio jasicida]NOJ20897.1 hypothetical protein [Vibrio jasicida]
MKGRCVYQHRDLRKVFHEDADRAFNESIKHRALIAKTLWRGEYNYISSKSALSEYGVISQIPIARLTIMTTDNKSEHKTSYGVIEFTHTKRSVADILNGL